jgi:hypothetical protein
MMHMPADLRVRGSGKRHIPTGTASYSGSILIRLLSSDGIHSDFILARRKGLEFITPVVIGDRCRLKFIGFSLGDDARGGNFLPIKQLAAHYPAAEDAKVPNILKMAESFDLLYGIGNGKTVISVVVENDGFIFLTPQKKQPAISDRELGQTIALRGQYGEGRRWFSTENFLWDDLKFLFVIFGRGDGGNGTDKNVGVPIGADAAIVQTAE